jgi:hypothetical protein
MPVHASSLKKNTCVKELLLNAPPSGGSVSSFRAEITGKINIDPIFSIKNTRLRPLKRQPDPLIFTGIFFFWS